MSRRRAERREGHRAPQRDPSRVGDPYPRPPPGRRPDPEPGRLPGAVPPRDGRSGRRPGAERAGAPPAEGPAVRLRRFRLVRAEDVSGVSGTGVVAEGVQFSSGRVVLAWQSAHPSLAVFDSLADLELIHGHEGRTWIEWIDP